jgi:hypothetical protein
MKTVIFFVMMLNFVSSAEASRYRWVEKNCYDSIGKAWVNDSKCAGKINVQPPKAVKSGS